MDDVLCVLGSDPAPWLPWLRERLALAGVDARIVGVDPSAARLDVKPRLVVRVFEPDVIAPDRLGGSAPRLLLCASAQRAVSPGLCSADDVLFVETGDHEVAWRLAHWWHRSPARALTAERSAVPLDPHLRSIVQSSPSLSRLVAQLPRFAQSNAPVLILGETGTGKELFARAVHYLSPRGDRALVVVNCAALPAELVDSEFFGHARGAFTGAHTARAGLIAQADGGTLFLDEVDSLPLASQGKLLRVLQEQEYRPVGADRTLRSNLRIVAASNRDIQALVRRGEFRQDLFYRLNVLPLPLPALRERRQDIWHLASHFIAKYAAEYGTPPARLGDAALRLLLAHDWPGNVRELEHVIERACLLHTGGQIEPHELALGTAGAVAGETGPGALSFREAKSRLIEAFERNYLEQLLAQHQGNVSRAAAAAQKNRRALLELLHRHGIAADDFRVAPVARAARAPDRSLRPSVGGH